MAERVRAYDPVAEATLRELGESVVAWRKLHRLTQEQVARRAGIARVTLTRLERGEEGVGIGALVRVLSVLGLDEDLREMMNPYRTQFAAALAERTMVQRVRQPRAKRRAR